MYPEQAAFVDEAFERDPGTGRRLYGAVIWKVPRKNGKTTMCGGLGLYLASPDAVGAVELGEGGALSLVSEPRPHVIFAAGSKEQAAETYGQAKAFIDDPMNGSPELAALWVAQETLLECPSVGGVVKRVAGDGHLNHGLNPFAVIADEIHAWHTPRQLENWRALTTAQGARRDPVIVGITTEGDDPDSLLEQIIARIRDAPNTEVEERNLVAMPDGRELPCLRIYRNRQARVLVYEYGVPEGTPLDRTDIWKAANPAPWRTEQRIYEDLLDPLIDEATKRRLYGNELVDSPSQWLPPGRWNELAEPRAEPAAGGAVIVAGDASRTRDTTAVAVLGKRADGRYVLKTHVWALRKSQQAHTYQEGNAINLKAVRRHIAGSVLTGPLYEGCEDDLVSAYAVRLFAYDPRFLDEMATDFDEAGLTVAALEPTSTEYLDALQDFYDGVADGLIVHDGDPVLAAHVRAAAGKKLERGWQVRKLDARRPIDALVACVIAYAYRDLLSEEAGGVLVLDEHGEPLDPEDVAIAEMFGWVGEPEVGDGNVQKACAACLRYPVVPEAEVLCPYCGYAGLAPA